MTAESGQVIAWSGIYRVDVAEDYVFVLTSPTSGLVVPERAFTSGPEYQAFREKTLEYWKNWQAELGAAGPSPGIHRGQRKGWSIWVKMLGCAGVSTLVVLIPGWGAVRRGKSHPTRWR